MAGSFVFHPWCGCGAVVSLYADLAADAAAILDELGQSATYIREASENVDPVEGVVQRTEIQYTVKIVVFDDAGNIEQGDTTANINQRHVLMAGNVAFDPVIGDFLSIGGKRWTVNSVKKTDPAGEVVLYKLQVRK